MEDNFDYDYKEEINKIMNRRKKVFCNYDIKNHIAITDINEKAMERSKDRRKKFQNNWKNASLKEIIEQFVPNAVKLPTNVKGKDIYTNGSNIEIVHDVIGKYFRIQDTSVNSFNHCYLTLEGKLELNKTIIKKMEKQYKMVKLQMNIIKIHILEI